VVAAQQVEDAVDEKQRDLPLRGVAGVPGLPDRGLRGNDDVPQHPGARAAVLALAEGERQHVRRAVLPPVAAVEAADLRVADQADRQLAVSES
jgi:hypothetical protein